MEPHQFNTTQTAMVDWERWARPLVRPSSAYSEDVSTPLMPIAGPGTARSKFPREIDAR